MTNASGRNSTHWAARKKERERWEGLIGRLIPSLNRPSAPIKRASLILSRGSSVAPDPDGLVSGFKNAIDALVKTGVLENDRYTNIGFPKYRWGKCKPKQGFLQVTIIELPLDHDYTAVPFGNDL